MTHLVDCVIECRLEENMINGKNIYFDCVFIVLFKENHMERGDMISLQP